MSDRLSELRRQRALIQEHLAWLDREIADAGGKPASPAPSASAPSVTPATPVAVPAAAVVAAALKASTAAAAEEPPVVAAAAEAILGEYRRPPDALHTDVKKGCILYFVAGLGAVALIVAILYLALSH